MSRNHINFRSNHLYANAMNSLYDQHPEAIFIFDTNGKILSSNQAAATSNFFTNDVNDGSPSIYDILRFIPIDKIEKHIQACLSGQSVKFTSIWTPPNEDMSYISVMLIPIFQEDQISAFFAILEHMNEKISKETKSTKIEDSLNLAQTVAKIGSWDYDVTENQSYWSNQVYRIFGIEDIENFVPTFESLLQFIHPDDTEDFQAMIENVLLKGTSYEIEYRLIDQNGNEKFVFERADTFKDDNGNVIRLIGTIQDITDQKTIELELQDKQQQFQAIYDNLDVVIWSYDPVHNKLNFISNGLEKIYGYSSDEILLDNSLWTSLIHPEDLNYVQQARTQMKTGESVDIQYRIINKFDQIKWVNHHMMPHVKNGTIIRVDGIITDITDQRKSQQKIEQIAYQDYLTGLANRRKLDQDMTKHIQNNKKFCLLYLDLDRFKNINDTLGHHIGDKLLIQVSKFLCDYCDPYEALVSRIGGDELVILLERSLKESFLFATDLLNAIKKPFFVENYEINITTSIGISCFPDHSRDAYTLLSKADNATSKAKESGKNTYAIADIGVSERSPTSYLIEKGIKTAIEKDEFVLYYQPRVDPKSGKIVSAEALIRWNHPEKGFLPPGDFIGIAEESHLILDIGDWVIEHVCKQINDWMINIPISVNISAKRFYKRDWAKEFLKILNHYKVDPSLIEIEITETSVIKNEEIVTKSISELKKMGIRIALDDFGTGFSSLRYIKDLNIDTIKIDRSFIQDMSENEQSLSISSSILTLGHRLGLHTVAEGVETAEQVEILTQLDCDEYQGFYFSKPLPADKFIQIYNENK